MVLSQFKNERIGFHYDSSDRDSTTLVEDLWAVLESAGWSVKRLGFLVGGGAGKVGVAILVSEHNADLPSAKALATELKEHGIAPIWLTSDKGQNDGDLL